MTVLEGCQWAAVKAVNFTGTWRKCLCVHRVGSLLSLGVSLLLFKLAIHAHVAVFHNQVGRQQCLCFVCSWTLPSNSSSSFSSSPSLPWPWQVSLDGVGRAGRGNSARIASWWDRHQLHSRRCLTVQAALRLGKYSCFSSRFIAQFRVPR